ncbi:MAG: hypothetical protein R3F24_03470 [Gammaproteobacteria bacterium]
MPFVTAWARSLLPARGDSRGGMGELQRRDQHIATAMTTGNHGFTRKPHLIGGGAAESGDFSRRAWAPAGLFAADIQPGYGTRSRRSSGSRPFDQPARPWAAV